MLQEYILKQFNKQEIFHHRIEIIRQTTKFCNSEKLNVFVIDKTQPSFSLRFRRGKKRLNKILDLCVEDLIFNKEESEKWFKAVVIKKSDSPTIFNINLYDRDFNFLTSAYYNSAITLEKLRAEYLTPPSPLTIE